MSKQSWNWTPRAHAIGESLTFVLCVGVYWLMFWVLF